MYLGSIKSNVVQVRLDSVKVGVEVLGVLMDDGLAMVYQCCPLALRFAHLPEVHSGEVKENRGLQRREEGGRERGWDSVTACISPRG